MALRLIAKRPGVWICRNRILDKRFPCMTAFKNEPLSVISRLDALIEQALHLAKAPPFTDIPIKMRALSVNRLLKKCRLRTKWSKMAVCP